MPTGAHHHRIYLSGWAVMAPATLYAITISPALAFGMLLGYGLGAILNPDADQLAVTYAEGIAIRYLSIFGFVWVGYWTIYAGIFRKKHRSFWTHFPFVSTAIRTFILFWWMYFVPWQSWYGISLFGIFLSLSIVDVGHYVSDMYFGE